MYFFDMSTLHERLKFLQGDASQADFSAKFDITQTRWGRFIRGETQPDAEIVRRICTVLNVEPRWLLFGEGPESGCGGQAMADADPMRGTVRGTVQKVGVEGVLTDMGEKKLIDLYDKLIESQEREITLLKENVALQAENADLKARLSLTAVAVAECPQQPS